MLRRATSGDVTKDGDDTTKPVVKLLYMLILATAITWLAPALLELDVEGGEILYDADGDPETNTAGDILCKGPDSTTPKIPCGGNLASCKGSGASIADCIAGVEGAIAGTAGYVLNIFKYVLLIASVGVVVVLRVRIPHAQYA